MTVISTPHAYDEPALFVDLQPGFDIPLHLKVEGFNFAGSVKIKAAAEMVERAEREGRPHRGIRCFVPLVLFRPGKPRAIETLLLVVEREQAEADWLSCIERDAREAIGRGR